jgi:hypothetical protein
MIYAGVFEDEQWVFHQDDSSHEKGFLSSRSFRESNLGLLSTSRQLRAETELLRISLQRSTSDSMIGTTGARWRGWGVFR